MTAMQRAPARVVGRYALYNEIAAGGMATIHLGRLLGPVGFARTVAVKRLHPQFAKDPEFVSMFLDEARLAARVQHPNVVATIDVVATDGELFLIMDYVRGESLSKILRVLRKRDERPPPRIAAAIVCGFLHGLHAAHEAKNERGEPLGLIHRDVSPQNVLVGSDGIARVLDFGIAKAQGRLQVTRDGQIKGKLAYMPPEQLAGREITRAIDIYASAVVMWETLTNERLFKGESEQETLAKIIRDPVAPPSAVAASVGTSFDDTILRALSRDIAKRHTTAKELALELERCQGIASPTEVGEWVERVVGHVLDAREEQIAAMESSSAGMSPSPTLSPDTDANLSLPNALAIHASFADLPTIVTESASAPESSAFEVGSERGLEGPPRNAQPTMGGGSDDMSAVRGLPKRSLLPVSIAAALALIVVGIVFALTTSSRSSNERSSSAPSSSATVSSATPPDERGPAPKVANAEDIPAPPVSAAPSPPVDDPLPTRRTPSMPQGRPGTTGHGATKGTAPKGTSAAAAKSNCDPPYVVDSHGRRKYKLECM